MILDHQGDDTSSTIQLFIPAHLAYFDGHFPDHPILPGIVQLEWACLLANSHLKLKPYHTMTIKQLKFMQVILPETYISLHLQYRHDLLHFSYATKTHQCSSGRVVFD